MEASTERSEQLDETGKEKSPAPGLSHSSAAINIFVPQCFSAAMPGGKKVDGEKLQINT